MKGILKKIKKVQVNNFKQSINIIVHINISLNKAMCTVKWLTKY